MASEAARAVLNHVLSALQPLGHPYALIGGVALAVWGYPRATRDVDLLIGVEVDQVERVIERLRATGFRPKRTPPVITIGTHRFAQLLYTPPGEFYDVQVDLLIGENEFQKSAIARSVQRDVSGVHGLVSVVNCDDLILLKLIAGRLIDRSDASMLLRENPDAIDFNYVSNWVGSLGLVSEYAEICREAFPRTGLTDAKPIPE